jgi:hypothetical protein
MKSMIEEDKARAASAYKEGEEVIRLIDAWVAQRSGRSVDDLDVHYASATDVAAPKVFHPEGYQGDGLYVPIGNARFHISKDPDTYGKTALDVASALTESNDESVIAARLIERADGNPNCMTDPIGGDVLLLSSSSYQVREPFINFDLPESGSISYIDDYDDFGW